MATIRRSLLCALAAFVPTTAALAADAGNGQRLAQRWCVSCHLIAPGQQGPTTEAPPFASIARRPDFTVARLAFFLLDPHPKMPDLGLNRTAAEDIAAYIATLK